MKSYEYHVLRTSKIPIFNDGKQIEEELNKLGKEGWRLIAPEWTNPWTINVLFFSFTWIQRRHVYYFFREKEEVGSQPQPVSGCGCHPV